MNELAFSFYDCAPVPQEPQISVACTAEAGYTVIAEAARDFRGWITVTAESVIRSEVRAFRRVVCEAKALFNRRGRILTGGLRL